MILKLKKKYRLQGQGDLVSGRPSKPRNTSRVKPRRKIGEVAKRALKEPTLVTRLVEGRTGKKKIVRL